jgi:hypothetical protein
MRWVEHVAHLGEMRHAYRLSVGKAEGNRSLGRSRQIWENNIEVNSKEVGYEGLDWIYVA